MCSIGKWSPCWSQRWKNHKTRTPIVCFVVWRNVHTTTGWTKQRIQSRWKRICHGQQRLRSLCWFWQCLGMDWFLHNWQIPNPHRKHITNEVWSRFHTVCLIYSKRIVLFSWKYRLVRLVIDKTSFPEDRELSLLYSHWLEMSKHLFVIPGTESYFTGTVSSSPDLQPGHVLLCNGKVNLKMLKAFMCYMLGQESSFWIGETVDICITVVEK